MSLTLRTPAEIAELVARRCREERVARGWTQQEFAERSGIALPTYRQFERTGRISLERLIRATITLGRGGDWEMLLRPAPARSIDELVSERPARQRGSRGRARTRPSPPDVNG